MFRRLANAANAVFSSPADQNVQTLQGMGFSEPDSRAALNQTGGNLEQAANLLLSRGAPTTAAPAHEYNRQQVEDDDLQRALQASLDVSNNVPKQQQRQPRRNMQSAAAAKAGKAALNRANGVLPSKQKSRSKSPISSHPAVKVPQKMSEKTKEEQILRTADRLKSSPQALDTLYKTLKTLQSNPSHSKFRSIDQSTGGYQKSLASAPGAEDLLLAMNYRKSGPKTLSLDFVDQATLYLGISALEQTKLTPEYVEAKALIQFQMEVNAAFHSADNSTEEAIARSGHMSKLPTEPAMGGAWIFVNFQGMEQKLQRKFDGDDTLGDVLHFIAGNGTQLLEKLKSGEWWLVDGHRNPPTPLDVQNLAPKTLQYIGCWPSGKLIIQPASQQQQNTLQNNAVGSARGLGAGVL